jgi:deoxyribonuclease-4
MGYNQLMLLGAHMSIAGGFDKAIERGTSLSCTVIQLFTKNSNQWKAKQLTENDVNRFKTAQGKSGIKQVIAHDSYLINLASGNPELRKRSVDALISEMDRCRMLGI